MSRGEETNSLAFHTLLLGVSAYVLVPPDSARSKPLRMACHPTRPQAYEPSMTK